MSNKPFWQTKKLHEMSKQEWESLCDGCGLCCLQKLQDEETDEVYYTNLHCHYLDTTNNHCTTYANRHEKVPECVWLTADQAHEFKWLPRTCAYRLIAAGKDLKPWHPLISGNKESVHKAGISMRGKSVADNTVAVEEWQDHIIWKA